MKTDVTESSSEPVILTASLLQWDFTPPEDTSSVNWTGCNDCHRNPWAKVGAQLPASLRRHMNVVTPYI